jgi:hypothetical protein
MKLKIVEPVMFLREVRKELASLGDPELLEGILSWAWIVH